MSKGLTYQEQVTAAIEHQVTNKAPCDFLATSEVWDQMEAHFQPDTTDPAIPEYLIDRILEVHLANLETVLDLAGDKLDMVYTYDDVATQNSLLISPKI